jgi:hypothetical protein
MHSLSHSCTHLASPSQNLPKFTNARLRGITSDHVGASYSIEQGDFVTVKFTVKLNTIQTW